VQEREAGKDVLLDTVGKVGVVLAVAHVHEREDGDRLRVDDRSGSDGLGSGRRWRRTGARIPGPKEDDQRARDR
jgi:hypothetical protein